MDPDQNQGNEALNNAPSDARPPLKQALFGVSLLALSVTGAFVLIASYASFTVENAKAEAAAAAVAAEALEEKKLFENLPLEAKSVYVYDAAEDREIFAKNGSVQLPLASITKVALALVVTEVLPDDSIVTVSRTAVERGEGGLTWGEEWRMRDLLDLTLMISSNTGAEALAEAADSALRTKYADVPTGNAAVWRMNALAQQLGLQETYFINPTGLDESPSQAGALSSARDIATLFSYALRTNPDTFAITTEEDAVLGPLNAPELYAVNTNDALPEITGLKIGKTGTTDLAGANIAIAFEPKTGHPVVIVVLGSTPEARFSDLLTLVDAVRKAVK